MTGAAYTFSPKEAPCFPPFVQWRGEQRFLSPPECRELVSVGISKPLGYGTIGNSSNEGFKLDKDYRCVRTRALLLEDGVEWLYQRIRQLVGAANDNHYRFDLTGIEQGVQFLRYDAPTVATPDPPGHYKWHQDFGGGASSLRKLSLVVQLSDPATYGGCELRMFTDCDFAPHSPDGHPLTDQGDAVLFPSWTPHMVSPITRGTRYAIAAWVCGPQLR